MRWSKPTLPIAVLAALLVALGVLASLQYHWISQVSQADLERTQAHLREDTAQFAAEFNEELQRAFLALQEQPVAALAQGRMIANLYRLERGRLLLFDRASGSFVPAEWPPRLAPLRDRILPGPDRPGPPPRGMSPAMDEGAPVLLLPPLRPPRPEEPPGPLTIAELNAPYLEKELLPRLERKHFSGEEGYAVRIVSRARGARLVYESDPGLPASFFEAPDARTTIFDVRPPRGGPRGEPPPGPPPGGPGRWEVLVKRRSGSLEAAVNRARRRNLAVGFAILFVMAAAIGMLIHTTRRAQRLARLQMEFVAGVSHELRTPLAVICSAGDNLSDGLIASPAQVRRYGGLIRNEGRRLSDMVEQILLFAGIQSGRAKYEPRPVDVSRVIHRALQSCQASVVESGCLLDEQIDVGLPPVMADETSLAHCVGNLVGNACKYGKQGKWVRVRARMAEDGRELRISVEDKGPGIDAADLPHIFDPFYRGSNANSDQIHGAGLGLSLVKRIMEAHGGGVEVASRREGGACFTLRLKVENGTAHPVG